MKLLFVSYDLRRGGSSAPNGQNYEAIWGALRDLGASHEQGSLWRLETMLSAAQVRDHLNRFADENDLIIVIEAIDAEANYNVGWRDSPIGRLMGPMRTSSPQQRSILKMLDQRRRNRARMEAMARAIALLPDRHPGSR